MNQIHSISARQQAILDFIREHGAVQVEPLAEQFEVTPQTIRRDLNQLYDLDLLQRVHGGAVISDSVENLGYNARKTLMTDEKAAIAKQVAELVPDNSSLFINIGTTTEMVARYLTNHKGLLVITNNINVASMLWPMRNNEVMVASGTIRHEDGGIVGPSTVDFVNRFKVDYAVIGCSAIDEEGEILDYDSREVSVTQTIIERSRSVILAIDSMKFNRRAPAKIADLRQIDYLVTDNDPSPEFKHLCQINDVKLQAVSIKQNLKEVAP